MIDATPTAFGITITSDGADLGPAAFQGFLVSKMLPLYSRVRPGWNLLIDVRSATLLDQEGFQTAATFIANAPNPPAKVAVVVNSAMVAMQISRLYKTAARGDTVTVFDQSADPHAFANAEASLK
jgi:hypothetical protein